MKILDLDMDYFMTKIATDIAESSNERLNEMDYGNSVWPDNYIRRFLEENLGLSKTNKIKGRIVQNHNESLVFWKELIYKGKLDTPFEVIHVDSHADLGLGYSSWLYILNTLLQYPVEERPYHNQYTDCFGNLKTEGIGDYLLFAIAYRWISKITYCANPYSEKNDYLWGTLKDFQEKYIGNNPVENTLQLVYNPEMDFIACSASNEEKLRYLSSGLKEPEVPFLIIPTINSVKYSGDFDFVVMAQSPNYTPASLDFAMDIFREYIDPY